MKRDRTEQQEREKKRINANVSKLELFVHTENGMEGFFSRYFR